MDSEDIGHGEFLYCLSWAVDVAQKDHPSQALCVHSDCDEDHRPGTVLHILAETLALFEDYYVERGHLKNDELAWVLQVALREGYDFTFTHLQNSHHGQRPYATLQMRVNGYLVMYNNLGDHSSLCMAKGFDHVLLESARQD
jgi:hypothetical protein